MPGTPATSPRFGAPRFANADAVDFAGQVNGVTDAFDLHALRDDDVLDETNVPNLAAAFTRYERLARTCARIDSSDGAGTYGTSLASLPVGLGLVGSTIAEVMIYLDAAKYNANARVTKLNLTLAVTENAAAGAVSYTAGLYRITGAVGPSGQIPAVGTVAAVVPGSTASVASAAALSPTTADSGDFTFPTAGAYAIAVVTSAAPAAGGIVDFVCQLEMRQV